MGFGNGRRGASWLLTGWIAPRSAACRPTRGFFKLPPTFNVTDWRRFFAGAPISVSSFDGTGIECFMPRFSRFHVLYSGNPTPSPGRKFRQIVAGPSEDRTFSEERIFGGDSA